ncbi:MAG TPA: histidine kinase [Bryobacteraceae bacterium]|nr:histidine kinase [Bryobacteraceae bacterium]
MAKSKDDNVADLYTLVQRAAARSGRALHDDVGPLLSAAGLHLQLLRMDHPRIEGDIERISAILDQAYERIRAVSQELAPSPVLRGGLKNALERLAELTAAAHPGIAIKLNYKVAGELPVDAACALYEAVHAAVAATAGPFAATRIAITAKGAHQVSIRIVDNGRTRGRVKALRAARQVAEAQGLSMTLATKQDTIVLIRYAFRRPTGG